VTNAAFISLAGHWSLLSLFDRSRIASFRPRSSRTDGQNAIPVAIPSEAWLRDVSLRAHSAKRSVPSAALPLANIQTEADSS
jgi:hypothetical protein